MVVRPTASVAAHSRPAQVFADLEPYDDCLVVLLWVYFCRLYVALPMFNKPLRGTVPRLSLVSVAESHHYENGHPKSHHSRNPQVCRRKSPSQIDK